MWAWIGICLSAEATKQMVRIITCGLDIIIPMT